MATNKTTVPQAGKSPSFDDIISDIERVAQEVNIKPFQVTKSVYFKYGAFNEWQIRKMGGLHAIVKEGFGEQEERDLLVIRGTAGRRAYVGKLERDLGDTQYFVDRMISGVRDALKYNVLEVSKPRKITRTKKGKQERYNVGLISDTHFGIDIDPKEVEGNEYNWHVAARRFGKVVQSLADYKYDHRKECAGLVLNFGGDLGQGSIHPQDHNVDLLAWQLIGAARYIIQAIDYLANYYDHIIVPVTPDNHLRIINHVKGMDRARAQKFDSYNSIIFEAVKQAFRHNPNIEFLTPQTPYTLYRILGWQHMLTHGDTVVNLGNPSKSVNIANIARQMDKYNASRPAVERVQVVLAGHVHTPLYLGLDNDVDLLINASLSGVDPFAQSIGIFRSRPGQWIYELTRENRIGDKRVVWTEDADKDSSYEKVIQPFDYDFALKYTN